MAYSNKRQHSAKARLYSSIAFAGNCMIGAYVATIWLDLLFSKISFSYIHVLGLIGGGILITLISYFLFFRGSQDRWERGWTYRTVQIVILILAIVLFRILVLATR